MFLAVAMGRVEVVRYLLAHGARADVADEMGRRAADLVQDHQNEPGFREMAALVAAPSTAP